VAKSNKQRREELKQKKLARARSRESYQGVKGAVPCNPAHFSPDGSYSIPDFVERGYYVDLPFECIDCGKSEVFTATQQKWWYEVAKGNRWRTARRCRLCRRKERERKNEARRMHLEGLAKKADRASSQ
jgi:hypothetical protein